jgi:thiamine-phosphate pyrophosphorylase
MTLDGKLAQRPVLSLVVDRSCGALPSPDAVEAAVAGGVDWVQIRERDLESAALLEFAREIRAAIQRSAGTRSIRLIVNRRVDIALALPAQGVHLGFDGLSAERALALLPPDAIVGCSVHSPAEAKAATDAAADYVHLAPIHAPLSKPASRPALGIAAIREASAHGAAVLAQGGVEARHCAELLRAGAAGIAVTGTILLSRDPKDAAAALRAALDE